MIDISKRLKGILLSNTQVSLMVGNRGYNIVNDDDGKPPFFVVELNNLYANYTKEFHLSDDISFSIVCIDSMYDSVITLTNIVRDAIEGKEFNLDSHTLTQIKFTGFAEGISNQLYTTKISFSCKSIKNQL